MSSRFNPFRSPRVWAIAFAIWSIPAVAFVLVFMLSPEVPDRPGALVLFLRQGIQWYFWALITPAILWLPTALPLDRAPRRRNLLLHTAFAVCAGWFFGLVWMVTSLFTPGHIPNTRELLLSMFFFVPFGVGVYATIAAVGVAIDFYDKLRERERAEAGLQTRLKEAQLGALRMQLQPHFLFNTLNTIAMLVREGETQTSVRMLARLSDLLRHLLDDRGDQEIPLRQELDFLSRYLEIEQLRFQDRLRVEMDVEEGTRDAFVPNLVLQPIVENALRHGIARRAASGTIALRAARENGHLLLSVCDDGPGLAASFAPQDATGIGLRNTFDRLNFLYGSNATMDVRNSPDQGVTVTLRIPWHETPVSNG
ncbi:MAG TPA: histidine kinase [Longimicrobiales bacterium]